MNIFFLSLLPDEIASMSCDQHVVKIQLEICQMLYTAWFLSGESYEGAPPTKDGSRNGYKPAHINHPMTMWVCSNLENYTFACEIGVSLTLEYTRRYGKIHGCASHLAWLLEHRPTRFTERRSPTAYYSREGIPECMPEQYRSPSITEAYQLYYMVDKMPFARYFTGRV
jgi:hypothetical protein